MPKRIRFVDDVRNSNLEEYKVWVSMVSRCYNRSDAWFSQYGGKGVKVCKRWRDSFDNFLADMGSRPKNNWITMKVKSKGYCKSNCVWIEPADLNRKRARLRRRNYSALAARAV